VDPEGRCWVPDCGFITSDSFLISDFVSAFEVSYVSENGCWLNVCGSRMKRLDA
jgi:hypothetical protein